MTIEEEAASLKAFRDEVYERCFHPVRWTTRRRKSVEITQRILNRMPSMFDTGSASVIAMLVSAIAPELVQ